MSKKLFSKLTEYIIHNPRIATQSAITASALTYKTLIKYKAFTTESNLLGHNDDDCGTIFIQDFNDV